jgi:acetylornithine/N-succinyldiaminopimelate aminotransferase
LRESLFPTYAPPAELVFTRGQGSYLYTEDNQAYLDLLAGIAVNSFGNCHPHLVDALKDQSEQLWHISNLFRIPQAERLADRLTELCFAERVFFANSGAEAAEAGIKSMRRYQFEQGNANKTRILAFKGSFHGRTTATIAASGNPLHIKGFLPNDLGFTQLDWEDLNAVRAAMSDEIAGIIVEPVRGEGGVTPASQEFLQGLREICDESGALLMFDEVQCGIGRTGAFFAHQNYGITPDVMALAKGLGGGFPIGACLTTAEVGDVMQPGSHGTTFGGNPLAGAVGNAVLDLLLEPALLEHVKARGLQLRSTLEQLCSDFPDLFSAVSGAGLMLGLSCKIENAVFSRACLNQHLVVGKAGGNMTRFLPPLNISDAELQEASEKLQEAAKSI